MSLQPGTLYFAYACNMDREHLSRVLERPVAPGYAARLAGHRLAFDVLDEEGSRFATIAAAEDGVVYGVVFRLPSTALRHLDAYEEAPDLYRRVALWAEPIGRRARQAVQVYIARDRRRSEEGAPDAEYLERVIRGADQHGLPGDYVDWIRARAVGEGSPVYRTSAT